jgi:predicted DCC family thiol-disulfide oxidoreductase YuxK
MVDSTKKLNRPLVIFDGACGFCRRAVERWRHLTGDKIDYAPFQELPDPFEGVAHVQFAYSVHLITASGEVYTGARAVFQALSYGTRKSWPLWAYRRVPGVAWISEFGYRLVADHRTAASKLAAFLWK